MYLIFWFIIGYCFDERVSTFSANDTRYFTYCASKKVHMCHFQNKIFNSLQEFLIIIFILVNKSISVKHNEVNISIISTLQDRYNRSYHNWRNSIKLLMVSFLKAFCDKERARNESLLRYWIRLRLSSYDGKDLSSFIHFDRKVLPSLISFD